VDVLVVSASGLLRDCFFGFSGLEYRYHGFAVLLLVVTATAHLPIALVGPLGQLVLLLQLGQSGTVLVAMVVFVFAMLSMRVHKDRLCPLGQLGHLLQIG